MAGTRLTTSEQEELRALARGIRYPCDETIRLLKLGFAVAGESRFGKYVRITETGKKFIEARAATPLRGVDPALTAPDDEDGVNPAAGPAVTIQGSRETAAVQPKGTAVVVPKKRGRPPTTGRYKTREELVEAVWDLWAGSQNMAQIARVCRVSPLVVSRILDDGKPGTKAVETPKRNCKVLPKPAKRQRFLFARNRKNTRAD